MSANPAEVVTLEEQLACAERELGFRQHVYPKRVEAGKMSAEQARMEGERMKAIVRTLRALLEGRATAPRPKYKPQGIPELQQQAARGVMLQRLAGELVSCMPIDIQLPPTADEALKVLRRSLKSMSEN